MRQLAVFLFISAVIFLPGQANGYSQGLYVGTNYHPHDDKNPMKHFYFGLLVFAGLFFSISRAQR